MSIYLCTTYMPGILKGQKRVSPRTGIIDRSALNC